MWYNGYVKMCWENIHMNITFLIGNGFDLNLNMKTSYDSFLTEYLKIVGENKDIRDFKEHIEKNIKLWSDAEVALGKYTETFCTNDMELETFLKCHEDFCEKLADYLQEEMNKFFRHIREMDIELYFGKALSKITEGIHRIEDKQIGKLLSRDKDQDRYNFINFNYTDTLNICFEITKRNPQFKRKMGELIHIHGDTYSNMLFGVNDESQIANKLLFSECAEDHLAQIIKPKNNQLFRSEILQETVNILRRSDVIYLYGTSLGITDLFWWKYIYSLLLQNEALHVIIYCHNAPEERRVNAEYYRFLRDRKEAFLRYCEYEPHIKEMLMYRIHISTLDMFKRFANIVPDDEELSLPITIKEVRKQNKIFQDIDDDMEFEFLDLK